MWLSDISTHWTGDIQNTAEPEQVEAELVVVVGDGGGGGGPLHFAG